MKTLAANVVARRAARVSTDARMLVWVGAKNRATGDAEHMGLWTGEDHTDFSIGGQIRTYFGAGAVLQVPPIQSVIGLEVRRLSIGLAAVSPEVEVLLRGYDPRFAPAEIHRAEFDADGNLLEAPERLFKGWINAAPILTPASGGMGTATIEIVSNARMLTRYGSATKSDQVQRLRGGDRFRRWATLTRAAAIFWGEEKLNGYKGVSKIW